jgi:hypothetical protein
VTIAGLLTACGGGNSTRPSRFASTTSATAGEGRVASPSPVATELTEVDWAFQLCKAAQTLDDQLTALTDGVDPTKLAFEDRKARAVRNDKGEAGAWQAAVEALRPIHPPSTVKSFHDAVLDQMTQIVAFRQADLADVSHARAADEIEAGNARFAILRNQASDALERAAATLPASAVAAIAAVTKCGRIPIR